MLSEEDTGLGGDTEGFGGPCICLAVAVADPGAAGAASALSFNGTLNALRDLRQRGRSGSLELHARDLVPARRHGHDHQQRQRRDPHLPTAGDQGSRPGRWLERRRQLPPRHQHDGQRDRRGLRGGQRPARARVSIIRSSGVTPIAERPLVPRCRHLRRHHLAPLPERRARERAPRGQPRARATASSTPARHDPDLDRRRGRASSTARSTKFASGAWRARRATSRTRTSTPSSRRRTGLVARWSLDENAGTAVRELGGTPLQNGTHHGAGFAVDWQRAVRSRGVRRTSRTRCCASTARRLRHLRATPRSSTSRPSRWRPGSTAPLREPPTPRAPAASTVVPLVTKGAPEAENSNRDAQLHLRHQQRPRNVLAADFEEGAGGTSPGTQPSGLRHHPDRGQHLVPRRRDLRRRPTWRLYLNGNLEATLARRRSPCAADSIQRAGLATP